MRNVVRQLLCVVATLAAMTACNNPPPATDAGTADGGGTDGARLDTGVPNDTGATATSCASPIDLNTAGTALATGTGRTIHTDNTPAPAAALADVAVAECAADDTGAPNGGAYVIFSYTMQTGAHLSASTDDPATSVDLDTIVWILDACTAGAGELGCNDDVDVFSDQYLSTAVTPSTISAGTTVTIVVAGYAGMSGPSRGAFTLNVSELPEHAAGETCDDANPFCVDGYACVRASATATSGTCNAFGTENAPCNIAAPFCMTGLGCSADAPTAAAPGTCQVPIASGEVCTADHIVCVAGNTCVADPGSTSMGHCRPDGGDGGLCRVMAPFCDSGLLCSRDVPTDTAHGVCQVPIATGEVCTDTHFVCVAGSTCELDSGSDTMGHCLADGTALGDCRLAAPFCDTGLECSQTAPTMDTPGTCQMRVASGGVCSDRNFLCATGSSCQLDDGSTSAGHCLADGVEYGACRLAAPFCDTGLTCSATAPTATDNGTCQMPLAHGAVCTPRHYLCVANDTCIADEGSMTMGHCITDGTDGGVCRDAAPECDGTLVCDPFVGLCGPA